MTERELLVDGKSVAIIKDFDKLREALLSKLTRVEAVYLAVALTGEIRTSEVADFLDMDKANVSKRLIRLETEGRVKITDESNSEGHRGRPSRVWAIT